MQRTGRFGWMVALATAAGALSLPQAAACRTFGQILDAEIPLEAIDMPLHGVRDRPRPELQPRPARIGGMAVSASLDATLGSTSNVLGTQGVRKSDDFAEWEPRLATTLDLGPDRTIGITLDYDGKRFLATPAKRRDGHYAGITTSYGFGAGGLLSATLDHRRRYEDQLAGTFPANGGDVVAIDQTHGQARLAQAFNRVRLTGALTFDRLSYHDTVTTTGALLPQTDRNDSILRLSSRIDYTLLADTALFAQSSWRATDFAAGSAFSNRSNREWRVIGGICADVSGLLRLSGGIGGYWRRYYAPSAATPAANFGRLAGFAWDLRAVSYISALTTVSVQSKREFVDANLSQSPGYEATSLQVQVDHELLRNLLLSAAITRESDDFRRVDRQDRLHVLALWADYWLSPQWLVKPRVEWLDRDRFGAGGPAHIPEIRTQLTLSVRE